MLKDVVSWDIQITTGNSGSQTCLDLCMRECHKRSSLLYLSTGILRRAMSLFMKGSKRMANKRVQATLNSAPDPRRYGGSLEGKKGLILIACYWAHLIAIALWIGGIIF